MTAALRLVDDAASVRAALTPLRADLLRRLVTPASATELAAAMGLPRQKVNYHLRVLEDAGLLELTATRTRRGCTERILRATAAAYVVDPAVLGARRAPVDQDRYAAEHLVRTAADTVTEVTRMLTAAEAEGQRLLTFTVEADVTFAHPADVHRFTDEVAQSIAVIAKKYADAGGRRYRVVVGGHPAAQAGRTRTRRQS